jgi:transcription antitermination factor NusG
MNAMTPWFALQTEPKNEKSVERLLSQKGYVCFLPTYRQKRRWSARTVTLELPLFPRYVFCQFNSSAFGKAVSTRGVLRVVGFGGKPAEIPAEEIKALQLLAQSDVLREPWAYIPEGTLVQVETGPLAGAHGVVCSTEDKLRLAVSVTLLQRSVAVQLDENTVLSVIRDPKKGKSVLDDGSDIALKLIAKSENRPITYQ